MTSWDLENYFLKIGRSAQLHATMEAAILRQKFGRIVKRGEKIYSRKYKAESYAGTNEG